MDSKILKLLIYLLIEMFLPFFLASSAMPMEADETIPLNSVYNEQKEPSYFLGGAIVGVSCNPLVDVATDLADPNLNFQPRTSFEDCKKIGDGGCLQIDKGKDAVDYKPLQSCVRQGIDLDNFKILVQAEPQIVFGFLQGALQAAAQLAATIIPGLGHLTAGATVFTIVSTCQIASLASTGVVEKKWIGVYQGTGMLGGFCNGVVNFDARLEGDKACVYGKALGMIELPIKRHDDYETETYGEDSLFPKYCVHVPPMKSPLAKPSWSPLISPVCTNYETSASLREYPISALVSQCIEDSMMNIFTIKDYQGLTFFGKMQKRMKVIIKALLTLYVVFIGFKFIIEKQVKRPEAIWFALKIAMVWYFAVGSGMTIVLPAMLDLSKTLSKIVLEASFGIGTQEDYVEETKLLDNLQDNYELLRIRYIDARRVFQFSGQDRDADSIAKSNMEAAKQELYKSEKEVERQKTIVGSFGYNYCDFRDFDYTYTDVEPYYTAQGLETKERTRNMRLMSLWDTLDCKMSKYLGIGELPGASLAPYSLIFGIAMIVSTPLGILIMILFVTIILFILLIILRIIQMYLIAIIAIFILCFIAPLIIPALLFSFTKNIFHIWTKQLISFTIQPVIIVAFITLLMGVYDQIFYGKNHFFYPSVSYHYNGDSTESEDGSVEESTGLISKYVIKKADGTLATPTEVFHANKMILNPNPLFPSDRSEDSCEDPNKLGCIYNKTLLKSYNFELDDDVQNETEQEVSDIGLTWPSIDVSLHQANLITVDLLKMIFISAIFFAAMNVVTSIASRLTDSAAGGLGGLATMPVPPPEKIAESLVKATTGMAKTPGSIASGVSKMAKSYNKNKKGKDDEGSEDGGDGENKVKRSSGKNTPGTLISTNKDKKGIKNG